MTLSTEHRQQLLQKRRLSEEHIQLLESSGCLESLSEQQIQESWLDRFPKMRGQPGGGLLLRFCDATVSLRADTPPWDEQTERPAKYQYQQRPADAPKGSTTQPWVPPADTGTPKVATEGFFDAVAATFRAGIPCCAATAPSHLELNQFPPSVKVYLSDADVPFHHFTALLPIVVGHCRRKQLKLAHLPRNPDANYAYTDARIPEDCKWGIDEWITAWQEQGLDPAAQLQQVIAGALDAPDYLRQVIADLKAAGISWPLNPNPIEAAALAIAEASDRSHIRKQLTALLAAATGVGKKWVEERIRHRDSTIAERQLERHRADLAAQGRDYDAEILEQIAGAEPDDTRGRCARLLAAIGDQWQADDSSRTSWRQWNGTHWQEVDSNDAPLRVIEEFMEANRWQDRELSTINSLLAAFRRSIPPATQTNPSVVPFRNGCLRLATRELIPHDPSNGNSWCLDFNWDPAASCTKTQEFLLDRLERPSAVATVRAALHCLLTGTQHKFFLDISGAPDTGKTVIQTLFLAIAGKGNYESGTLERLEDRRSRFETYRFKDKRLAVFSEAADYRGSVSTLKAFTGRDPISAERKNSTKPCSFIFPGVVLVVGNAPFVPVDPSGAVVNRRRVISLSKAVPVEQRRQILELDPDTGEWVGDLAHELPGIARWAIEMPVAEVIAALSKNSNDYEQAQAELEVLIETTPLATWAEEHLIWDPEHRWTKVGTAFNNPDDCLFPAYRRFLEEAGTPRDAVPIQAFKRALVDLLRDTCGLPLPKGSLTHGHYRDRADGSVVPFVRFRDLDKDSSDAALPGLLTQSLALRFEARLAASEPSEPEPGEGPVMDREGPVKAENPVGVGSDGCEGLSEHRSNGDFLDKKSGEESAEKHTRPIGAESFSETPYTSITSYTDWDLGRTDPSQEGGDPSRHSPADPSPDPAPAAESSAKASRPRRLPPQVPDEETADWLLDLRAKHPTAHYSELARMMDPNFKGWPTGRQVKEWLEALEALGGDEAAA